MTALGFIPDYLLYRDSHKNVTGLGKIRHVLDVRKWSKGNRLACVRDANSSMRYGNFRRNKPFVV